MITSISTLSENNLKMNLGEPVCILNMCRVCMMTSEYLNHVVSYELTSKIINMLNTVAEINAALHDCLPSVICDSCYTRLIDSVNFRNLCIESNNTLRSYLSKLQCESIDLTKESSNNATSELEVISVDNDIKIETNKDDNKKCEDKNVSFEFININPLEEYKEPSAEVLNALGLVKVNSNDSVTANEIVNSNNNVNTKNNVNAKNNNNVNSTKSVREKKESGDNNKHKQTLKTSNKLNKLKVTHNNKVSIKKSTKKNCNVCNVELSDYGTYRRHLATHGERPYMCKLCGKRFGRIRALKDHISTAHSGCQPYSCAQCGAKFESLTELTVHVRRHAGNSTAHACPICPCRFANARQLREHSITHESESEAQQIKEQERPKKYAKTATGCGDHVCSQCDRRFRKRCDLERHERVHSGEKPYECKICGGRFQQAHNLTKHMVTHTGIRSYTCDICRKTFGRSDVLARHMHVHEVTKPYTCTYCTRTFARHSQLISHVSKRHPNVK